MKENHDKPQTPSGPYDVDQLNRELAERLQSDEDIPERERKHRHHHSSHHHHHSHSSSHSGNHSSSHSSSHSDSHGSSHSSSHGGSRKTRKGNHISEKRMSNKRKSDARWKKASRVLTVCVCLLLALTISASAVFFYMRHKGNRNLSDNKSDLDIRLPKGAEKDGDIIIYKGHKYKYNDNIITILMLGLDTPLSETGDDKIGGGNGQADTLVMAVLNKNTNHLSFVNISREAMVDVKEYNVDFKYLGLKRMQICLSYAFGNGRDTSCLNTIDAVSRLMFGMPIHGYMAMDYDGISVLNDAVGGVTVEVLEDLTDKDPALKKGEQVTLQGNQAQTYVRSRHTEELESNELRMERQKQYMNTFSRQVIAMSRKNLMLPFSLVSKVSDHVTTDVTPSSIVYLSSLVVRNGITGGEIKTVPGKVVDGGKYAEFIPNNKKLFKLILNTFYEQVE